MSYFETLRLLRLTKAMRECGDSTEHLMRKLEFKKLHSSPRIHEMGDEEKIRRWGKESASKIKPLRKGGEKDGDISSRRNIF